MKAHERHQGVDVGSVCCRVLDKHVCEPHGFDAKVFAEYGVFSFRTISLVEKQVQCCENCIETLIDFRSDGHRDLYFFGSQFFLSSHQSFRDSFPVREECICNFIDAETAKYPQSEADLRLDRNNRMTNSKEHL